MEDLNRLKIVLAEQKRTGKWLADQLGKNTATVSKWCTNTNQPDLQTLAKIAEILGVYKMFRYNLYSPDGTESYWDDFVYPKSSTIDIDQDKVTIIADNSIICLQAGIDLSSKRIIAGNETYKARDYKTGNEFHIIFAYNNADGTEVLSVRCVYKETSELFQAIKLNTPF